MKLNIIFPIAGLGSRFGNNIFKPFLLATEDTFIELAKAPFNQLAKNHTLEYYFIFRKKQEDEYQVSFYLKKLFPNDNLHFCIIGDTNGPLQTIQQAIKLYHISGTSFVCDCDHSINITPMIDYLNEIHNYDVFIPTWEIEPSEYEKWGKVLLEDNQIKTFCEKEYVEGNIKGLLGCYLFRNIETVLNYPNDENISDVLKIMHKEDKKLKLISITEAYFFGIPETLQQFRFQRAQKYTLFVDVEGTLINQETKELLPGSLEKLDQWITEKHKIVLTTATNKEKIMKYIQLYNIPYHQLICDLTPGPRYVINDKKPYIPYYTMAEGLQINRNEGINNIDLENHIPTIKQTFEGASLTNIYLLSNNIVRKYAYKDQMNILKRQCEDLKRLYFYHNAICPKVLNEYHSSTDYYYDMEYLENYKQLSLFNQKTINKIIQRVLLDLHTYVYCYQKKLLNNEKLPWINNYITEKLVPKYHLLLKGDVIINNIQYKSIEYYLNTIKLENYAPDFICPIHGDLTLENIMYNSELDDYKLIDPAGSRYMDASEMDIGKLFQSIVCDYVSWKDNCDVKIISENNYIIPDKYLIHKEIDFISKELYKKGIFYMCSYFIRMIPFMKHKSDNHVIFIQLLTIYYLSTLY
jgi:hypothetical protein